MNMGHVSTFIARLGSLRKALSTIPLLAEPVCSGQLGPFPAPSQEQINEAEKVLGLRFPSSYVQVLRELRQGLPPQFSLYWIGDVNSEVSITAANERLRLPFGRSEQDASYSGRCLPSDLIAFADNEALDVFAFDTSSISSQGEYPIVAWREKSRKESLFPSFMDYLSGEVERLTKYCSDFNQALGKLGELSFRKLDEDVYSLAAVLPQTRPPILRLSQSEYLVWKAYLRKGLFDTIIQKALGEYVFSERYVQLISDELLIQNQTSRMKKLWKGVIAQRLARYKEALRYKKRGERSGNEELAKIDAESHLPSVLDALKIYANILEGFGDATESEEVRQRAADLEAGKEPPKRKVIPDKRSINEDLFWTLIDEAKQKSLAPLEQVEELALRLEAFRASEIKIFQKILNDKMCDLNNWDLWALAHLRNGGCSDDSFEYFRAGLILMGRKVFETAVRDVIKAAELLPKEGSLECESFLYVAQTAYESKCAKPMALKVKPCSIKGIQWKEKEVEQQYPELCIALKLKAG